MFHRTHSCPQHLPLGLDKDPVPAAVNQLPPDCGGILILLTQSNPLTLITALFEEGRCN